MPVRKEETELSRKDRGERPTPYCRLSHVPSRRSNTEFDQLFAVQSRMFEVAKRAEITRQMERLLLHDIPDDRGYYWQSAMAYWNRVQHWPPLQGTTVSNFGKFEQIWCQGGKCM